MTIVAIELEQRRESGIPPQDSNARLVKADGSPAAESRRTLE